MRVSRPVVLFFSAFCVVLVLTLRFHLEALIIIHYHFCRAGVVLLQRCPVQARYRCIRSRRQTLLVRLTKPFDERSQLR